MDDLIAKVEMSQEDYKSLEGSIEMTFRGWKSAALQDLYKKNPAWRDVMAEIRDAYRFKEEIEQQIKEDHGLL